MRAQIERDEAQLNNRPFVFPQQADSEALQTASEQKEFIINRSLNIKRNSPALTRKSTKPRQLFKNIRRMHLDISSANKSQSRSKICGTCWPRTALVSQYNLLISQDQRLEILRTLEFDHNSLVESQHTLASIIADRDAFIQQWSTQLSQDLATARGNLDTTQASLEKALRHHDLVRLTAAEHSVVLTVAALSVGSVLKEGDTLFTLMP